MDGSHREDVFHAEEIARRWGVEMDDLAYMAENGDLRVSVRVSPSTSKRASTRPTRATANSSDPVRSVVVHRTAGSDGLRRPQGASSTVRLGSRIPRSGRRLCRIIEPSERSRSSASAAGDPTEERDRIEDAHGRAGNSGRRRYRRSSTMMSYRGSAASANFGCRWVGPGRGDEAPLRGMLGPGTDGASARRILAEAGSASKRMSDVYKSKPRMDVLSNQMVAATTGSGSNYADLRRATPAVAKSFQDSIFSGAGG